MTAGDTPAGKPGRPDRDETLARISGQLDELIKGRRMRDRIITALVAAVAVLALILALEHNARTSDNATRIAAEEQGLKAGCLFANRARAGDLAGQRQLYSQLARHHALTKAEVAADMTAVRKADMPRDCAHLASRRAVAANP